MNGGITEIAEEWPCQSTTCNTMVQRFERCWVSSEDGTVFCLPCQAEREASVKKDEPGTCVMCGDPCRADCRTCSKSCGAKLRHRNAKSVRDSDLAAEVANA